MKRHTAILALGLLFSSAFVLGKGGGLPLPACPDSLRSLWLYTEGIKQTTIKADSLLGKAYFQEAVRVDSTFAPAYFELASNGMYSTPEEGLKLAETAFRLDTTNKWYHQLYGQTLLYAQQYKKAERVFQRLCATSPNEADNYRILAALYEQNKNPFMALITLDSAEMRFGRIPYLSTMKRRLLVSTGQTDKAISEAQAMVEAAPHDSQSHAELAELYGQTKKDSLALIEFDKALQIDSTNVEALMSLADFHAERQDFRSLLSTSRRIFLLDEVPLDTKVKRFQQFTSDTRFYREYYPQLNDLATTLAIRYPNDRRVVELYARHLIASGELEQALSLYKIHLADQPPVEDFYRTVIDIESYLQRPDSVSLYVDKALKIFPDKVDFQLSKGHVRLNQKRFDEAIGIYKSSLRYAQTDSLRGAIWGMIGDAWHMKATKGEDDDRLIGQPSTRQGMAQSYKAYDKSLRYYPDNALVLNNYAYFLSLEGRNLEKALTMSTRALALTDNNPTYLDTHAWVLYRLGRAAEAKKVLQQAIALDRQGSPALMVHYGDILNALGERFLAESYWRKALEKGYNADEITRRIETKNDK